MGISSAVARRYEWIVSSNEFGHSDGFPGECNCGFVGDWDPSLAGFVGGEDNISRNEGCCEYNAALGINLSAEWTGEERRWTRFGGERESRGRCAERRVGGGDLVGEEVVLRRGYGDCRMGLKKSL
jgi:hypothetical protein